MPVVHKSAIKRARQSEKRHARNHAILHRTNTVVKKFKTALEQHDVEAVHPLLREATSALHRAVTKGALHRNTASRRISQLSTQVNALKAQ
jgi:small subunit ribosomal protein S20